MAKQKKTTSTLCVCPICQNALRYFMRDKHGRELERPYMFCTLCLWFQHL